MPIPNTDSLFDFGVSEWLTEPETAFDAFLVGYRFNGRRLRASSFAVYKGMFSRLLIWAKEQGKPLFEVGQDGLQHFLDGRRLSAQTRHRYLLLFSTMFEHLAHIRAGQSPVAPQDDNPARSLLLEREAPGRDDPDFLEAHEVQRFMAAIPSDGNWKRQRDRALLMLLLGSGLRSSEVLSLCTSDLLLKDGAPNRLWVQAHKPRPARQVPIQHWAIPPMSEWLQERARYASGNAPRSVRGKEQRLAGNLLFPANLAGAALNPLTLFRLVKTTLEAAGLVKRYEGPTLLRNSCGAMWLQKHEPLQVSLWLGHETLRTTELLLPRNRRSKSVQS
jgi:integrase